MKLSLCVVLSAAALALVSLPFQARRLRAQTTTPSVLTTSSNATFGMVGIATGQTARVNALNLAAGGPIVAGGSCHVTATFLDENGKTLLAQTLPVGQGQAVHFDLPRTQVAAGLDPVEIRAVVTASFGVAPIAATSNPVSAASCSIFPTMEIYDQITGRTSVLLENPRALPVVLPLAAAL